MNRLFDTITTHAVACVLAMTLAGSASGMTGQATYSRTVKADFDDISLGVESAILDRGFVIDYHAKIGDMLERTGEDVGSTTEIFSAAETWQFCSAVLSRKMMETEAANIAFCPYVIFAYSTATKPDTVTVGFRRAGGATSSPSSAVLDEVNSLLESIVDEASGS